MLKHRDIYTYNFIYYTLAEMLLYTPWRYAGDCSITRPTATAYIDRYIILLYVFI